MYTGDDMSLPRHEPLQMAKNIVRRKTEQGCRFIVGSNVYANELVSEIVSRY